MPKTNKVIFSRTNQQRVRRMKNREISFQEQFNEKNIKCCSLNKLLRASPEELIALVPILKKIAQHNKKTNDLIMDGCFSFGPEVNETEVNENLFEHLQKHYAGHRGKTLKYTFQTKKDRFRETIIKDSQDIFNNCLKISAENSIKKYFNSVDVSKYNPTDKYLNDQRENALSKNPIIEYFEPVKEIIISEAPDPPKLNLNVIVVSKEPMKTQIKKIKSLKIEPVPITQSEKFESSESDNEDLDDFESNIKKEMDTDRDINTTEDLRKFAKLIKKQINTDLKERVSEFLDNQPMQGYEHLQDDREHKDTKENIIMDFAFQFKSVKRKNPLLTKWTSRNPISTNKIINSMVSRIIANRNREITNYKKCEL